MRPGAVFVAAILCVHCGGSSAATVDSPPPSPLPAELSSQLAPLLAACDQADASACEALGRELVNAGRAAEAIAAFDHGCHLGSGAKLGPEEILVGPRRYDGKCALFYGPTGPCDPAACPDPSTGCKPAASNPACVHASAAECLEHQQAGMCARAADTHSDFGHEGVMESPCGGHFVGHHEAALAYAKEACARFDALPGAGELSEERHMFCSGVQNFTGMLASCARQQAANAAWQEQMAASRARAVESYMTSLQALTATNAQLQAANRGVVLAFAPGAAPGAGTPGAYVNPATGLQWTSPGLALLAALFPESALAATASGAAATQGGTTAAAGGGSAAGGMKEFGYGTGPGMTKEQRVTSCVNQCVKVGNPATACGTYCEEKVSGSASPPCTGPNCGAGKAD